MINDVNILWKALRPKHWIKNTFVFAPLFFTPSLYSIENALFVFIGFLIFCGIASSIYLFNDIVDLENDKNHPVKKLRPIPSGDLPVKRAAAVAVSLVVASLALCFVMVPEMSVFILTYGLINVFYTLWLKNIVIIDIFSISMGFVLRVAGGAAIIDVVPTPWILICTLVLSLFLALGKRRHELYLLEGESHSHRPVLESYSKEMVDQLITIITPITIMAYILYTLDPEVTARFDAPFLFVTGLFVILGVFRYIFIIHKGDLAGSPVEVIFKDRAFLLIGLAWILSFVFIIFVDF